MSSDDQLPQLLFFGKVFISPLLCCLRCSISGQFCQVKYLWLAVFFLSALCICHLTLYHPPRFLLRSPLITLSGFPFMGIIFFLLVALKILSLILDSFIAMCLGEDSFGLKILVWLISFLNLDVQVFNPFCPALLYDSSDA